MLGARLWGSATVRASRWQGNGSRGVGGCSVVGMVGALALAGCDRGCTRDWLAEWGVGASSPRGPGPMPLNALDCPDGLARCEDGFVAVSRLARLPQPCRGPAKDCQCPWEPAGECAAGCVAEGVEVVVEPDRAKRQLCAPGADAPVFATDLATPAVPFTADATGSGAVAATGGAAEGLCDEGDRYRCVSGEVLDCASRRPSARCLRGCVAEGASIDDDAANREAAFAILCSR